MKLGIPEKSLDQHIAILGKTGSGKTFTAKAIVEHLLDEKRQVCVCDPTSAWWGLRLGADGKSKGYDVVLLGGKHADIPLAPKSGEAVARLVTQQRANVVLDTSGMTVGEYTRWFIDFAGTLYTTIQQPLHLVIDEAHYFMPQGKSPDVDAGRMLHAGNRLMSGGRSLGIRGLVITQRPAKFHKDSLTCVDTLIAMRVIAPQDRQAVKDWIDGAGDPVQGKEVLDSLAQLQRGEGWVWYPEGGYLQRVKFPRISTYDSSATPKHGAGSGPAVKEIKLDEVKAAMADAVREAEANDPKLLKQRIAELERAARTAKPSVAPIATADPKAVERAVTELNRHWKGQLAEITKRQFGMADRIEKIGQATQQFAVRIDHLCQLNGDAPRAVAEPPPVVPPREHVGRPEKIRSTEPMARNPRGGTAGVGTIPPKDPATREALQGPERRVLDSLAFWESVGVSQQSNAGVAMVARYSATSTSYTNPRGAIRAKGLIDFPQSDYVRLTEAGRAVAISPEGLTTLAELHSAALSVLDGPGSRLLKALIKVYPAAMTNEELAEAAGYSPTSTSYTNPRGRLRSIGLAEFRDGGVAATAILFPEGLE